METKTTTSTLSLFDGSYQISRITVEGRISPVEAARKLRILEQHRAGGDYWCEVECSDGTIHHHSFGTRGQLITTTMHLKND